jgi:hypothetical protein
VPWNEFLLPVLAGYIFINLFNLTKFRAQRQDGYRLLIESLFYGVAIFTIARILAIWIDRSYRIMALEQWLRDNGMMYPLAGTTFLAVLIALVLALLCNLVIRAERAKRILVKRHDNGFLRLFHRAAAEYRMVSVTLSNRKVYIGYVFRIPNLSPEEQFVGLLPVVSGYRDKDTLRLVLTTNYGPVLAGTSASKDDFEVTFALGSIESANLFDPIAYPLFDAAPTEAHASLPQAPTQPDQTESI